MGHRDPRLYLSGPRIPSSTDPAHHVEHRGGGWPGHGTSHNLGEKQPKPVGFCRAQIPRVRLWRDFCARLEELQAANRVNRGAFLLSLGGDEGADIDGPHSSVRMPKSARVGVRTDASTQRVSDTCQVLQAAAGLRREKLWAEPSE
jgi:hypothetical protein